jgi:hypothetical protein
MIVTSLILRQPAIRRALEIPITSQVKVPTVKETWAYTKKWKDDFVKQKQAEIARLEKPTVRRRY